MSYNTSVQLGQTAFLICKVAPGTESVSKLSYCVSLFPQLPLPRPHISTPWKHLSQTNYKAFVIQGPARSTAKTINAIRGSISSAWLCAIFLLHLNQSLKWKLMMTMVGLLSRQMVSPQSYPMPARSRRY